MTLLHANTIRLQDKGLLILGDSGSGKSALSLALIERAQRAGREGALIADDYSDIKKINGALYAAPPKEIEGLMEVWGAGIFAFPFEKIVKLTHAIALGAGGQRYPEKKFFSCLEVKIPLLSLGSVKNIEILLLCHSVEAFLFKKKYEDKQKNGKLFTEA